MISLIFQINLEELILDANLNQMSKNKSIHFYQKNKMEKYNFNLISNFYKLIGILSYNLYELIINTQ